MSRFIFPSQAFEKRLLKFLKFHPETKADVKRVINLLENDLQTPSLKTHKLHGRMDNSYACSIDHRYRIVFSFDNKYVYPESIGTHDDVY